MRRMLGLITLAVCMLTGCGRSDAMDSDPAGDQLLTVEAVVDELSQVGVTCRDLKLSGQGSEGQPQLFAHEHGHCWIGDEDVNVATFDGSSQREQYLQAAKQFGAVYVTGEGWAIGTETQATAEKVKDALGGEIR